MAGKVVLSPPHSAAWLGGGGGGGGSSVAVVPVTSSSGCLSCFCAVSSCWFSCKYFQSAGFIIYRGPINYEQTDKYGI